jgi:hypothetical protein
MCVTSADGIHDFVVPLKVVETTFYWLKCAFCGNGEDTFEKSLWKFRSNLPLRRRPFLARIHKLGVPPFLDFQTEH